VPGDHDIASATWTRRAVAQLIRQRVGVQLTLPGVGKYLRRWGLTPQKPARQAREQDPEEMREFVERQLPAVKERVEQEEAQLHFVDEVGVQTSRVYPGLWYDVSLIKRSLNRRHLPWRVSGLAMRSLAPPSSWI
jgi:hypothetical protein